MSGDDLDTDGGAAVGSDAGGPFPLPLSIRQGQIAFYAVVALYVVFLLVTGWQFKFENKLFPYVVGIPTLLITLGHIAMLASPSLRERFTPDTDTETLRDKLGGEFGDDDVGRSAGGMQRYGLVMLGWVVALPVLVYYFGYAYVLPPYVFAFIWHFRRDVKLAAATAVGFSVAAYFLFIVVLGMIPWAGELGLPSLLNNLPF
ncbi:MAG: tripartite tricarboxylate transporter TctB family protein [Haloferacaceae archaeon]